VGARVTDLQKDRFTMEYKIASAKHRAVAGEGTGLIVAYDYGKQVKAEVPAEVAAKIQAVEKGRAAGD
jgi:acyl-CoA thioester hydrolase